MKTTRLKKRVTKHAGTGRTCSECRKGKWSGAYYNYQGKPFMCYCEHSTYAYSRRMQENSCLACTPACKEFEEGEKGQTV